MNDWELHNYIRRMVQDVMDDIEDMEIHETDDNLEIKEEYEAQEATLTIRILFPKE